MLTPDLARDNSESRYLRNEKGTEQSFKITFAKTCDLLWSGKRLANSGGFRLAKKATTLHAAAQFLVHFFAITTRLRQKFPMYTYEGEFLFLFFFLIQLQESSPTFVKMRELV